MFSFLINLDQTIHECGDPEKPFEKGRNHDRAHDGGIYNLERKIDQFSSLQATTGDV